MSIGPWGSPAVVAICAALVCACTTSPSDPDAAQGTRQLSVMGVGPDVGLKPGRSQKLRVRYTTVSGAPLADERVRFAIFGDPQGSTLLADSALTSSDGIAAVEIRAGAVAAGFRVRASAALADDLLFYVEVSGAGFGTLQASVAYEGTLSADAFREIEYRLYKERRCAGIADALAPPTDDSRRRSTANAKDVVVFEAMAVLVAYSLFARGFDARHRVLAAGCVDLPRTLIRPEQEIALTVRLWDVQPTVAGDYAVSTAVVLPTAARPLARALQPWVDLVDCPGDPLQLLLDCILDALDGGDPLDCVIESPSPKTEAILGERGAIGKDGCREELTARMTPALEHILIAQMPKAAELRRQLRGIEAAAFEMLRQVDVSTMLTLGAPDESGALLASHRLVAVTFQAGGKKAVFDVGELGVFAPAARSLAGRVTGWKISLGEHALGLGYGLAARQALGELVLGPADLPVVSSQLAIFVADLVTDGSTASAVKGCAAIEATVCAAARLGPRCLGPTCAAGLAALASYLESGLLALEAPATMLDLQGSATLVDDDGDGVVDRLRGEVRGSLAAWTKATLHLSGEALPADEAPFQGVREAAR